jgi:hypothetical protein
MAGNVSITSIRFASPSNRTLDFILAACDVEGNFLVVKAYQYTDLLSCMLLDAYVFISLLEFPLLNASVEQMGDPIMHVLLLGVYAEEVRVEPARCTWFSLLLLSFSFPLTITRFSLTLGYPDLCWRSWNACGI